MTQRAVELQLQLLAENPNDGRTLQQTAAAYQRLIVLLHDLSEFESALATANDALAMLATISDDPALAGMADQIVNQKTSILRALERLDDAEQLVESNRESQKSISLLADARRNYESGLVKSSAGRDPAEAIAEFDKAILIYEQIGFHAHLKFEIARCFLFRGTAEMARGNLDDAQNNVSTAAELFTSIEHPGNARETLLEDTGRCWLQLGRITHTQLLEIGMPVEPAEPLLSAGRRSFNRQPICFSKSSR